MQPSKLKALLLLKQLNALVRRVSKTGDTAKFNGRILNFLSGAFPIGERSGVNLRGEYAPKWEEVSAPVREIEVPTSTVEQNSTLEVMEGVESTVLPSQSSGIDVSSTTRLSPPQSAQVPISAAESAENKKVDFYSAFWSLQTPISAPPSYFQNKKSGDAAIEVFKTNVTKILSVFAEATRKERLSSSSKGASASTSAKVATSGDKRKRDEVDGDMPSSSDGLDGTAQSSITSNLLRNEYFFAKFLTSYNLLELEVGTLRQNNLRRLADVVVSYRSQTFTFVAKFSFKS